MSWINWRWRSNMILRISISAWIPSAYWFSLEPWSLWFSTPCRQTTVPWPSSHGRDIESMMYDKIVGGKALQANHHVTWSLGRLVMDEALRAMIYDKTGHWRVLRVDSSLHMVSWATISRWNVAQQMERLKGMPLPYLQSTQLKQRWI